MCRFVIPAILPPTEMTDCVEVVECGMVGGDTGHRKKNEMGAEENAMLSDSGH